MIAIQQIGSNAVPTLLKMVQAKDSAFKSKLMDLAGKQSMFKISFTHAYEDRWLAYSGFLVLKSKAISAIPQLSEIVENEDEDIAVETIRCLSVIGPESLPTLIKALTNSNARVRGTAAYSIGEFGSAAKTAVPTLLGMINLTGEEHPDNMAIRTLGEVGDDSLIPLFSQCLLNKHTAVEAGFALGRRGSNAIAPLMSALTNSEKVIRGAAIAGLDPDVREIGPGRERMVDDYSFARVNCIYNLKYLQAGYRMQGDLLGNSPSLTNTPPATPLEEFSR